MATGDAKHRGQKRAIGSALIVYDRPGNSETPGKDEDFSGLAAALGAIPLPGDTSPRFQRSASVLEGWELLFLTLLAAWLALYNES